MMMTCLRPVLGKIFGACLALTALAGSAYAQSCEALKAEYRSLGSGGGSSAARQEIARLSYAYQQMGCANGGFLFFGPPPACSGIVARMRSLQSQLAAGGGDENRARKAHLRAAIAQACGESERASSSASSGGYTPRGGRKLVCVRTCDGFFFPLANRPEDGDTEEMCQALCPGAETAVYRMQEGGAIQEAVSNRGQSYMSLPNALKYRTGVSDSCACKKADQTWSQALARAESMIARRGSDIVVDAKLAAQMSQAVNGKSGHKGRKAPGREPAEEPADIVVTPAKATTTNDAPVYGSDAQAQRSVRVIAPEMFAPARMNTAPEQPQAATSATSQLETGAVAQTQQ